MEVGAGVMKDSSVDVGLGLRFGRASASAAVERMRMMGKRMLVLWEVVVVVLYRAFCLCMYMLWMELGFGDRERCAKCFQHRGTTV